MYFDELRVTNFGPFEEFRARFSARGINILSGPNGSGKTSVVGSIMVAVYGARYLWLSGVQDDIRPSRFDLIIREADVSETLTLEVPSGGKLPVHHRATMNPPLDQGGLSLHTQLPERPTGDEVCLLLDPAKRDTPLRLPCQDYCAVDQLFEGDAGAYEAWRSLRELLCRDLPSGARIDPLSEGQAVILRLSQEYIKRRRSLRSIPLLIDELPTLLGSQGLALFARLVEAIGDKDQVLLLTKNPDPFAALGLSHVPHTETQIALHRPSGWQSPAGYRSGPGSPVYIRAEGKTDLKHLKAALGFFQTQGEFGDLGVEFLVDPTPSKLGSDKLLQFCEQQSKLAPDRPIVAVFDRDEPTVIEKVEEDGHYKHWGNNVFSLALPVPSFRQDTPDLCIELYYHDEDLTRMDANGRRLFLGTEFDRNSGRQLNGALNCLDLNRIRRGAVIDNHVFDAVSRPVALSKDDFADNVLNGAPGFRDMDFSSFRALFLVVEEIARGFG